MDIASPRILIVDDKPEHGEAIARKLWQMGYASLYVEYDERFMGEDYQPSYQGVRFVFMDLDLTGAGWVGDGSSSYAGVAASLQKILDQNNGPWFLITWTQNTNHGDQLFEYLESPRRLPNTPCPLGYRELNKEDFIDVDSGKPKNPEKDAELAEKLRNIIGNENAVRCLLDWESSVLKSANDVIAGLSKTAMESPDETQDHLSDLLYELAQAVAGKRIEGMNDYAPPLYAVLTTLLSDRLSAAQPKTQSCLPKHIKKPEPEQRDAELAEWKRRINTMINLDSSHDDINAAEPGTLAVIPEGLKTEIPQGSSKRGKFIRRHFLCIQDGISKSNREKISQDCELLLLNITPPCDYAQRKEVWVRYAVACRVPLEQVEHVWMVDRQNQSNTKVCGKPKGNFIRVTPEFMDGKTAFVLLINANLQLSLSDNQVKELAVKYRIREAMMADVMGWLGCHITRLGHLFLATP